MPLVTATFNTGGAVIIDDTVEVAAIAALTSAITAQTLWLQTNLGIQAAATPMTMAAHMGVSAAALNDVATMMTNIMKTQAEQTAALKSIQVAMGGMSAQMASGVTTQQLAVADQIKNNKFNQQTTNASLVKAGEEPTEVKPGELVETVRSAVSDVSMVKAQAAAAGIVEQSINESIQWTSSLVTNYIAESYIGQSAASAWGSLKTWLGFNKPTEKTKGQLIEIAATARSNLVPKFTPQTPVTPPTE